MCFCKTNFFVRLDRNQSSTCNKAARINGFTSCRIWTGWFVIVKKGFLKGRNCISGTIHLVSIIIVERVLHLCAVSCSHYHLSDDHVVNNLKDARAKFTCLGIHVEPCLKYHQQLHFVGKSYCLCLFHPLAEGMWQFANVCLFANWTSKGNRRNAMGRILTSCMIVWQLIKE